MNTQMPGSTNTACWGKKSEDALSSGLVHDDNSRATLFELWVPFAVWFSSLRLCWLLLTPHKCISSCQLPATCHSSGPLVFNKVSHTDRRINTIPCFDALWMKWILRVFVGRWQNNMLPEVTYHLRQGTLAFSHQPGWHFWYFFCYLLSVCSLQSFL